MPAANRVVPVEKNGPENVIDSVWNYHKYISYDHSIEPYGKPSDIKDFTEKAQLVNYDQYRALIEGFSAHMWDWYTGVIIWKTQNPWTAMRGQMYDYYLDPNACLYGLQKAGEPLHILFNAADSMVMVVNNGFEAHRDIMLQVKLLDMKGKETVVTQVFSDIGPTAIKKYLSIQRELKRAGSSEGVFLVLRLLNTQQQIISDNFYWLPDASGNYSGLQKIATAGLQVSATATAPGKIAVIMINQKEGPVAFFNRVSLIDPQTKKRLLPVFYSDNYVSILPGEEKTVTIDYSPGLIISPQVTVKGWNLQEEVYPVADKK
jgi:hypothetical protein